MIKQFQVGIKAFIKDDRGALLIKHARGYWDLPGGRVDDNENFTETLTRELSEELPGSKLVTVGELLGAQRESFDIVEGIGLAILFYKVEATIPQTITLSEEHTDYLWVKSADDIPKENLKDYIRQILIYLLK